MKKIVLLFLAATLSSCGFHLKNKQDLAHLAAVRLRAVDELRPELTQLLTQQNVAIDENAPILLTVTDFEIKRRQSAIGNVGDAREVELNYVFNVSISRDEKTIATQKMTQSTYLHYQSDQYLGGFAEENQVKNSLKMQSAHKILRFLAAHTK